MPCKNPPVIMLKQSLPFKFSYFFIIAHTGLFVKCTATKRARLSRGRALLRRASDITNLIFPARPAPAAGTGAGVLALARFSALAAALLSAAAILRAGTGARLRARVRTWLRAGARAGARALTRPAARKGPLVGTGRQLPLGVTHLRTPLEIVIVHTSIHHIAFTV